MPKLFFAGIVLAQNTDKNISNQSKSDIEPVRNTFYIELVESINVQTEGTDYVPQDYTLQEINHAFNVMESFVIYDEKKNIKFDISATKDPNVTEKDIDIALDFAVHNNAIMNATVGSV